MILHTFAGVELIDREEMRQVARANHLMNSGMYDAGKSHRPDKRASAPKLHGVAKKANRTLNSKAFKDALKKCKELSAYTKITQIIKRKSGTKSFYPKLRPILGFY